MTRKFDFLQLFYDSPHTGESLINDVETILATEAATARAIPFYSARPPHSWLQSKSVPTRRIVDVIDYTRCSLLKIVYSYKDNGRLIENAGHAFIWNHDRYPNLFVAISLESGAFYRRALLPLLHSLHPQVQMTFLTLRRMKNLLTQVTQRTQLGNLKISRASVRLRFKEALDQERVMPTIIWPNLDLADAFAWVYENNGWFKSLSIEATRQLRANINFALTYQGHLSTDGMFPQLFSQLVLPICETIHENAVLFEGRNRRSQPGLMARPLAIRFQEDQFAVVEEQGYLIQALRKFAFASMSVMHRNPYMHATILDYRDGSTFDLWILDEARLMIVPQLNGTMASIKRLLQHIFEAYGEGRIEDVDVWLEGSAS